jgi:putative colanic acid biosynthesis acetyltransferase WcaF
MNEQPPVYVNRLSLANRLGRAAWSIVWLFLFRPSPKPLHAWRRFLLRLFGAHIAAGAHPDPSCKIWAPWNLTMGPHSCLANYVDCYCVAPIELGAFALVSQYSYLCAATHDYQHPEFPLIPKPIVIGARAWVAAGAFIGPGVEVGEGAVCGARSVVMRDVEPWTICAGNPAKPIRRRTMRNASSVGLQNDVSIS